MSTIHEVAGEFVQYTKGAPDVVLQRCTTYQENGQIYPLTDTKRQALLAQNKAMADRALRVLAAAERRWLQRPAEGDPAQWEQDLCFLGLTGMMDPVRPEVAAAIAECRQAGIRPVMITGDHKDTAVAIGKQLQIIESSEQALTGAELDALSDEELEQAVERYGVCLLYTSPSPRD